jgi:hypothetical protein
MKKTENLNDKFLSDLLKKSSEVNPSKEFLSDVMARVESLPAYKKERKPFFLYLKAIIPWVLLGGLGVLILSTSDLPYTSYIPGSGYFKDVLFPSLLETFGSFSRLFSNSFFSIAVAVVVAGFLLFALERLARRRYVRHQYLF